MQRAISKSVSFAEAFRFWAKLGFISFGGPAGQIAIMHRELVDQRRWISEERFLHALNYCMLLPGPEAQQLAIYIGWLLHGTWGGIVAGSLFIIPSIFLLLALSYLYAAYGHLTLVVGILAGIKPVVVAIVVEAVFKIGGRAIKKRVHLFIAIAAFIAIYFLHVPFPLIVLGAGVFGLAGVRLWPRQFANNASARQDPDAQESDQIRKATDVRPSTGRAITTVAAGALLWFLPLAVLLLWSDWNSIHARQYRFFTIAALVTFGGAYAVLAYVTQAAVGSFGWITQSQAIDGLALAETTPGPLIMVLLFVGFMAGWNHPAGMSQTASAVTGALITTYVTFLPSFIFIFLGAPYMESLRGNANLTSALSCITSAVVGVILNLALIFGVTVIWPNGLGARPELLALLITGIAFLLLYRFKVNVLWVVLFGGVFGLLRTLLVA